MPAAADGELRSKNRLCENQSVLFLKNRIGNHAFTIRHLNTFATKLKLAIGLRTPRYVLQAVLKNKTL